MAVLLTKNKIERSTKGLEPKTVKKYSSILQPKKLPLDLLTMQTAKLINRIGISKLFYESNRLLTVVIGKDSL